MEHILRSFVLQKLAYEVTIPNVTSDALPLLTRCY
jgi:hypothetical protein